MALLGAVSASTVNVNPSMSNSQIQSILNNAKSGDTVNFLGRFYEDVQLTITKTLHLVTRVGTVLYGTNSTGSIVLLITGSKASGTTISGFNITNSETGVVINNTNWTTLNSSRIKSVSKSAVAVNGSSNTNLANNNITNSGTGITVEKSKNTKISSTKVSGSSKNGITVNNSENTALNHDTLTDNDKHGVVVYNSKGTVINGTTIKNSESNAIGIYNSSKTVINSSKMTGNGKSLSSGYVDPDTGSPREENGNGVYVEKSDKVKVLNCNISENYRGISANSVKNLTVENNLLVDNNFDGILLSGIIKTSLIKSNVVQANNNGIRDNAYSSNLTVIGNIITYNEKNFNGCSNGHGLIFGTNFVDAGTIVTHNIITKNTYSYGDGYYGKIFPGLGSNFYGDFDYNLLLKGTTSTNMKLVVIRTGENNYSIYFTDDKGNVVTELPSVWLKITTSDGNSYWVQTNGPITDITTAAGSGDITATLDTSKSLPYYDFPTLIYASFAIDSTTISSHSAITSKPHYDAYYYPDWDDSDILKWVNEEPSSTEGPDPGINPGSSPDNHEKSQNTGDNPNNNPKTADGTGANKNNAGNNNTVAGLTAVTNALTSVGDTGSKGGGNSNTKTAQELFIDNAAKNPELWGVIGIIVLLLIIFGAYYRNDLMNMIQKAKK